MVGSGNKLQNYQKKAMSKAWSCNYIFKVILITVMCEHSCYRTSHTLAQVSDYSSMATGAGSRNTSDLLNHRLRNQLPQMKSQSDGKSQIKNDFSSSPKNNQTTAANYKARREIHEIDDTIDPNVILQGGAGGTSGEEDAAGGDLLASNSYEGPLSNTSQQEPFNNLDYYSDLFLGPAQAESTATLAPIESLTESPLHHKGLSPLPSTGTGQLDNGDNEDIKRAGTIAQEAKEPVESLRWPGQSHWADMEKLVRSQLEATNWATVAPSDYLLSLSDAKQSDLSMLHFYNDSSDHGRASPSSGNHLSPDLSDQQQQMHSNHRYNEETDARQEERAAGTPAPALGYEANDPMTTLSDGSSGIYSLTHKSHAGAQPDSRQTTMATTTFTEMDALRSVPLTARGNKLDLSGWLEKALRENQESQGESLGYKDRLGSAASERRRLMYDAERAGPELATSTTLAPHVVRAFARLDDWRQRGNGRPRVDSSGAGAHEQEDATLRHSVFSSPKSLAQRPRETLQSELLGAGKISAKGFMDLGASPAGFEPVPAPQVEAQQYQARPQYQVPASLSSSTDGDSQTTQAFSAQSMKLNGSLAIGLNARRYKSKHQTTVATEATTSVTTPPPARWPTDEQPQQQQQQQHDDGRQPGAPLIINFSQMRAVPPQFETRTSGHESAATQAINSRASHSTDYNLQEQSRATSPMAMLEQRVGPTVSPTLLMSTMPAVAMMTTRQPSQQVTRGYLEREASKNRYRATKSPSAGVTTSTTAVAVNAHSVTPGNPLTSKALLALYAAALKQLGNVTRAQAHHHHLHSHIHSVVKPALITIPVQQPQPHRAPMAAATQVKYNAYEGLIAAAAAAAAAGAAAAQSNALRYSRLRVAPPGAATNLGRGRISAQQSQQALRFLPPLVTGRSEGPAPASPKPYSWPAPMTIPIGGTLASIPRYAPAPLSKGRATGALNQQHQKQGFLANLIRSALRGDPSATLQPPGGAGSRTAARVNTMQLFAPQPSNQVPAFHSGEKPSWTANMNSLAMRGQGRLQPTPADFEEQLPFLAGVLSSISENPTGSPMPFDFPLESSFDLSSPQLGSGAHGGVYLTSSGLRHQQSGIQRPSFISDLNNYLGASSDLPTGARFNVTPEEMLNGGLIDWSSVNTNENSSLENMFDDNLIFAPLGDNSNLLVPISLKNMIGSGSSLAGTLMSPGGNTNNAYSNLASDLNINAAATEHFHQNLFPSGAFIGGGGGGALESERTLHGLQVQAGVEPSKKNLPRPDGAGKARQTGELASPAARKNVKKRLVYRARSKQNTAGGDKNDESRARVPPPTVSSLAHNNKPGGNQSPPRMPYALSHYIDTEHNPGADDHSLQSFLSTSSTSFSGSRANGFRPIVRPFMIGRPQSSSNQSVAHAGITYHRLPTLISYDDGSATNHYNELSKGRRQSTRSLRQQQQQQLADDLSLDGPLAIYEPQFADGSHELPLASAQKANHNKQMLTGGGATGAVQLVVPSSHQFKGTLVVPTDQLLHHALMHASNSILRPHLVAAADYLLKHHLERHHHHHDYSPSQAADQQPRQQYSLHALTSGSGGAGAGGLMSPSSQLLRYSHAPDLTTSESARLGAAALAAGSSTRAYLLAHYWPLALALLPIMIVVAIVAQLVMAAPLAMFALTAMSVTRFAGSVVRSPGRLSSRSRGDSSRSDAADPLWYDLVWPARADDVPRNATSKAQLARAAIKLAALPSSRHFIASIWPNGTASVRASTKKTS